MLQSQIFSYDANGNRLNLKEGTEDVPIETIYSILAESNRLTKVGEIQYQHDASGNIIDDGEHTYSYDARNRLIDVDGENSYLFNANNMRVRKTTAEGTTLYGWDNERIFAEYNESGNSIQETVYFGSTPIALLKDDQTYRIYADQIGTPRIITDNTNTSLWAWDSKPFGESQSNEDVDGDNNKLSYNLRFPGQYYDKGIKKHYNYNRDYDPLIGRYIQNDPIGLDGGLNVYGYVTENPLIKFDSEGLSTAVIIKTEAGGNDPWGHAARYAARLSRNNANTSYIYSVKRVSQLESILNSFWGIDNLYIIGHSSQHKLYIGQAASSDTNISMNGRGDVSPYSINWNTYGLYSRVHLWGCNAGKGSSNIAQHIARASGSTTSAFQNYINFTSDGRPFIRWWRSGKKVWFNP